MRNLDIHLWVLLNIVHEKAQSAHKVYPVLNKEGVVTYYFFF